MKTGKYQAPTQAVRPRVLWWGRGDADYSRNQVVMSLFSRLGWELDFFRPAYSRTGGLEAHLVRPARPNLVWVPCFRQADIAPAARWARRWGVPLVADPLISSFQKEAEEREKYDPESPRAKKRLQWESSVLNKAGVVVADTPAHARYFFETLGVPKDRLAVLFVGAQEEIFTHRPMDSPPKPPFEVFFYGSFLALQGPEVIVEAARLSRNLPAVWTLLGRGDLLDRCRSLAQGLNNVRFEPWIAYRELPARIARADVVLGIFGATHKADMVIPNKVYQSMAVGRPLVTRRAEAFAGIAEGDPAVCWVAPGNPASLAEAVAGLLSDPESLPEKGRAVRDLYDRCFAAPVLLEQLSAILEKTAAERGKP
ncbi:MAG: glycosyltransferase [Deltaproteobacteria bacterium]|nr:glycosyltransferase [Deltaproteobacteria bacterium]